MAANGGQNIIILYKVVNHDDTTDMFNAFSMPRTGKGPTLASIKR